MHYYLVAPAKTFHETDNLLTYASDSLLRIGHLVEIPLGRQTTYGIVVKNTTKPDFPTKPIIRLLYDQALPPQLLKALTWLTDYYRCPMSTVVQAILPRGITKKRRAVRHAVTARQAVTTISDQASIANTATAPTLAPAAIPLNAAQQRALAAISTNSANTILLHGITGSGKTNIYLALARQTLAAGQSVILLVPEIALTSQLVQNFQNHFEDVILLHSQQTEAVRHRLWEQALRATTPQIIIGPRSALFAPVAQLGLIIIDEAHEPSYHQDQNPKYSALRLAAIMSKTLLGSATPLVADYYICQRHHAVIALTELAVKSSKTAHISVIDLKNRPDFTRSRILSNPLIASIQASLDHHRQSLIFHNRRGTAPLTICDHCGWQALCTNCFLPLVLHADQYTMRCHTCGRHYPVPIACPDCGNATIHHKGFGTKLIEAELRRLFPHARIARFDADTESNQQLHKIYTAVHAGDYDLLVGTQMIAKGFDFPRLSTLGVVQADAGLSLPDYASEERTYELITQVIGRANRGHQDSNIFIQSFQPDHPIIGFATTGDYAGLYQYLIQKRRQSTLPPYSFLLKLSLTYKTESSTVQNIQKLHKKIIQTIHAQSLTQIIATPPMPAFHERSNSGYSWQIVLKAKSRKDLLILFDQLPKNSHLHFDFDPPTLL